MQYNDNKGSIIEITVEINVFEAHLSINRGFGSYTWHLGPSETILRIQYDEIYKIAQYLVYPCSSGQYST